MEIDFNNCPLSHAVLHDTAFIPGPDGRGTNLKGTLDTASVDGKQKNLKMTLHGTMVLIEVNGNSSALFPLTNFKLLVPSRNK